MGLKKTSLYLAVILLFILHSSCNKSKRGCTDKDSENFEPKATEDCSCCYYYAKAYIWYRDPYYNYLKQTGTSILFFYVDGNQVGKASRGIISYEYYSGNPSVNENNFGNYRPGDNYYDNVITLSLGEQKSKTFVLVVKDEDGNFLWQGNMNLTANKVKTIELN